MYILDARQVEAQPRTLHANPAPRLRLPSTFPSTHVYLKNSYLVLAAEKYANSTINSLSLGEIALMVRQLVNRGSNRDEIMRGVGWKYESVEGVRVPAPAGERVLCEFLSVSVIRYMRD